MYFHAPCGVVLYSVMLCLYIVECNCNFYEHKKNVGVRCFPSYFSKIRFEEYWLCSVSRTFGFKITNGNYSLIFFC